jgi:hypothetical protein
MRGDMKIFINKGIPENSMIAEDMECIDFFDSYSIRNIADRSIEEMKSKLFALPGWISFLLTVRQKLIVEPFGLSTGKHEVPILFKNENEIVVGEDDKHLYFRISVLKKNIPDAEVFLSTAVRFNNFWGKLYFTFVKPFHKQVVKSMLKGLDELNSTD